MARQEGNGGTSGERDNAGTKRVRRLRQSQTYGTGEVTERCGRM